MRLARCSSMAARVRLCVEALEQHHVAPDQQRLARPHRRTVVVQRPGHHEAAVAFESQRRRCLVVDERRIAGDDQLRPPGRAARRRRLPRRRHGVGHRTIIEVAGRPVPDRQAHGVREALGLGSHDDLRLGERDDLGELARRELGGHRLRHGAELPTAEVGDEPVHGVRQRNRHEVADADATRLEVARHAVAEPLELGSRNRASAAGDRREVGVVGGEV